MQFTIFPVLYIIQHHHYYVFHWKKVPSVIDENVTILIKGHLAKISKCQTSETSESYYRMLQNNYVSTICNLRTQLF